MDKTGKIMWGIFWLLALAGLSYFFQDKIEQQINPNQQVTSSISNGKAVVTLKQNRYGHYIANGTINNTPVTFLLDTGATQISVPAHLGTALGLSKGRTQRVSTANGVINVSATIIDSLSLGEIKLHQLKGHLNPGMTDNTILLGMNALKQLELVQRNNHLTLIQRK